MCSCGCDVPSYEILRACTRNVCMYGGQWTTSCLSSFLSCLRQGSLVLFCYIQQGFWPLGFSSLYHLPMREVGFYVPNGYMNPGDVSSGPHICAANTFYYPSPLHSSLLSFINGLILGSLIFHMIHS